MARRRSTPRNYTTAWPAIAKHIKAKAAWKCERCGQPHDRLTGHVLTVAHLDPAYGNHRLNLAALCQRCHLKLESGKKCPRFAQGYMFEHSEWFTPHLEGWQRYQRARRRDFPSQQKENAQ